MDKLNPDGPLMIAAEQLVTAYELAKDDGLQGNELHAVVARLMAERERAARREALEQACKAVCHRCADGIEARREGGDWYHGWGVDGRRNGPCYAGNIRVLMSEPEEAKPAGVVHRYAVTRVDDFGDAWQVHWEAEDHGGRATIAKSQLPGCTPTPGATVELSFDVLGGFLGGRIIDQIVEAVPCSNS